MPSMKGLAPSWSALRITGMLAVIALAATVITLLLQIYFGRLLGLVLLGQLLSALAATVFVLWIARSQ
jgi:hypothetical protein